jgi:hypothetical protein
MARILAIAVLVNIARRSQRGAIGEGADGGLRPARRAILGRKANARGPAFLGRWAFGEPERALCARLAFTSP